MSSFSVNAVSGVYSYSSANVYSYLGRFPANGETLKRAFNEFNITPTGDKRDLDKLGKAMYAEYSEQIQDQIANQNREKVVPWADLCAQIGVRATGDYEKDYAAFNDAIQLLSQSAMDGQAMAFFAGVKSEASKVFGQVKSNDAQLVTFKEFQAQFLG